MNSRTVLSVPDESDKYLVYAKLDNAKVLHQLVKAVSFKDVSTLCLVPFKHMKVGLFYTI
jgi:hypothetical protein